LTENKLTVNDKKLTKIENNFHLLVVTLIQNQVVVNFKYLRMRQLKKINDNTGEIRYDDIFKNLVSEDACYPVTANIDPKFGFGKQTFVVDWQMQVMELWDFAEKSKSKA